MNLIIAKDGVKREIDTPFALCCNARDLRDLISELQRQHAAMVAAESQYGWSRIDPSHPLGCGEPINPVPLKWTETDSVKTEVPVVRADDQFFKKLIGLKWSLCESEVLGEPGFGGKARELLTELANLDLPQGVSCWPTGHGQEQP